MFPADKINTNLVAKAVVTIVGAKTLKVSTIILLDTDIRPNPPVAIKLKNPNN